MNGKVLSLKLPQEDHYVADACLFWCFDDRLWRLRKEFIKQRGFYHVDIVQAAGGAKALAEEGTPAQQFLLDQLAASIRLHHAKVAIPTLHFDCGAMDGSKSFAGHEAELEHHHKTLAKIKGIIQSHFPDLPVESYIAGFDGLHAA